MMNMGYHSHQYALDTVPLLNECIEKLHIAIDQELFGYEEALDDLKIVLDSRFLWWDETFLHASNYGSHGISISFTGDEEV